MHLNLYSKSEIAPSPHPYTTIQDVNPILAIILNTSIEKDICG